MRKRDISQWLSVHVGVSTLNLAKAFQFLSEKKLLKARPTRSGVINLCVQIVAGLYDEDHPLEDMTEEELIREFLSSTPAQREAISKEIMPGMAGHIEAVISQITED